MDYLDLLMDSENIMVRVKLNKITKTFGNVKAVNEINLEIKEGELFFLLGPSGCGKTTTLRLVAGFYKPDRGSIFFDSQKMNGVSPNKRNIGMVFQNYALWPHMSVYDNLTYGLKVRGVSQSQRVKKAKRVLNIVKMEKFAKRYPNQLSGGQQQRIALARALVIEPDILLFDEPLSNLDAKLRIETRQEIRRIQKELGITTIYVTHDQSEALSMADSIAVMNVGRIEQVGNPREIYNYPKNKFVAGFIGETNFLKGKINSIQSNPPQAEIKTNLGESLFADLATVNFSLEDPVLCSIRPENIKVYGKSEKKVDEKNLFEAEVQSLNYYGFIEHYILQNLGIEMKAINFNPGTQEYKVGDSVYLTFKPKDVDVFLLK